MTVERVLRFLLGRPDPVPVLSIAEIAEIGRRISSTSSGVRSVVLAGPGLFALGDAPALDLRPSFGFECPGEREFLGLPFLRVGEPDPRLEAMLRDLS